MLGTKLEPADRLQRMQQVVNELERMPDGIDQDHRILVSGLASRIYADTLSNREAGASDVLEACRRVLSRTDPQHVPTRVAQLNSANQLSPSSTAVEDVSPVPPPLAPLAPVDDAASRSSESAIQPTELPSSSSASIGDAAGSFASSNAVSNTASSVPKRSTVRASLSDDDSTSEPAAPARMHLTAGSSALPSSTSGSRATSVAMPVLSMQATVDPHSPSASSRTRVIPQEVEPLPVESKEPPVALSGIEKLPIDQLVRLLSSVQPRVSQAASLTLKQRGMSDANLELAIGLATGAARERQELLTQLVQREDLDARPWLLWMAADGQDSVRQHAVSLLQPLADSDVRRQLRLLLNKERDEKVAQTMRQVLAGQTKN